MTARVEALRQMESADQARRMAAMIREGVVSDRRQDGMVRVDMGDLTTDWLPQAGARVGDDVVWWPLDIGEQVIVLSPSGDSRNGLVIGGSFSDKKAAPSENLDRMVVRFRDGTEVFYDRAESILSITAVGETRVLASSDVSVESETLINMKAPKIKIQGDVDFLDGYLKHNGVNVGSTHKHGSVQPGPGVTNVPQ